MLESKFHIQEYLQTNKNSLIEGWSKKLMILSDDPYQESVVRNGELVYEIILQSVYTSYTELIPQLESLAKRIAEERVSVESDIGYFVYNVSLGRSEIFHHLYNLDILDENYFFREIFDNMNQCFDTFLFYAVSHYNTLKDRIIEEKNSFINQSHKDRLTLLGQMTSSFIHEFRNPLTSIQGFIQLLRSEHKEVPYLDIIAGEIEQLNFRISQFLLLSKKEMIEKEKNRILVQDLIEELLSFLYPSLLSAKVEVFKKLEIGLEIYGFIDEIRQVFMNILFNAIDVLQNYRQDPQIHINNYLKEEFVVIEFSNNGPTIPKELLQTIFEPFVTTKQLGTGLGLFVCKEIIEKHGGTLECYSDPDKTTFKITLPKH